MEETIWTFGNTFFKNGFIAFAIYTLVVLLITHILVKLSYHGLKKSVEKKHASAVSMQYLNRIIRTILYVIAFMNIISWIIPLDSVGRTLLVATSVASVVLGLAAQETFGNFIAGFFMSLSEPFEVGDFIVLKDKGISGTVRKITFRHTVLETFENTQLVIPNSVMNSAVIDNRRRNEKGYVCMLSVPVAYESDIEKVRSVINKVLSETEGVIDVRSQAQKKAGNPFVNVRVENFLDSGVEMKFPVACADYISSFAVCSSVRSSLLEEFAKENIEIPYNKVQILQ